MNVGKRRQRTLLMLNEVKSFLGSQNQRKWCKQVLLVVVRLHAQLRGVPRTSRLRMQAEMNLSVNGGSQPRPFPATSRPELL